MSVVAGCYLCGLVSYLSGCVYVGVDDDVNLAQPDRDELQSVLRTLNSKLEDIRTHSDGIEKHGSSLERVLVDLQQSDSAADAAAKMKSVCERARQFHITSSSMITV